MESEKGWRSTAGALEKVTVLEMKWQLIMWKTS